MSKRLRRDDARLGQASLLAGRAITDKAEARAILAAERARRKADAAKADEVAAKVKAGKARRADRERAAFLRGVRSLADRLGPSIRAVAVTRGPAKKKSKRAKPSLPGYEGRFSLGQAVIEDPSSTYDDKKPMVPATVNTRAFIADTWFRRRAIGPAEKQAADEFVRLWSMAARGGPSGIDPTGAKIDHGASPDIPVARLEASRRLTDAKAWLGPVDFSRLGAVLGNGESVADVARASGYKTRFALQVFSGILQDALGKLADHWGFSAKGGSAGRVRGFVAEKPSVDPSAWQQEPDT